MNTIHYLIAEIRHFYFVATFISLAGWTIKSAMEVLADHHYRAEADQARRDNPGAPAKTYYPNVKYGDLIWRIFFSIVPVANLWMIVYLVVPNAWQLIEHFFKQLNKPIVPPSKTS